LTIVNNKLRPNERAELATKQLSGLCESPLAAGLSPRTASGTGGQTHQHPQAGCTSTGVVGLWALSALLTALFAWKVTGVVHAPLLAGVLVRAAAAATSAVGFFALVPRRRP